MSSESDLPLINACAKLGLQIWTITGSSRSIRNLSGDVLELSAETIAFLDHIENEKFDFSGVNIFMKQNEAIDLANRHAKLGLFYHANVLCNQGDDPFEQCFDRKYHHAYTATKRLAKKFGCHMPALSKKKMFRGRKFVKRTLGPDGWLTNPRGLRKWLGFKKGGYAD